MTVENLNIPTKGLMRNVETNVAWESNIVNLTGLAIYFKTSKNGLLAIMPTPATYCRLQGSTEMIDVNGISVEIEKTPSTSNLPPENGETIYIMPRHGVTYSAGDLQRKDLFVQEDLKEGFSILRQLRTVELCLSYSR